MKKFKVFIRHSYFDGETQKILDIDGDDAVFVREELLKNLVCANQWSTPCGSSVRWEKGILEIVVCEVIEEISEELKRRVINADEEEERKEQEEEDRKKASGYYLRPEKIPGNQVIETNYVVMGIYEGGDKTHEEGFFVKASNDKEAIKKMEEYVFRPRYDSNETFYTPKKHKAIVSFFYKRKSLTKIETYERRNEYYGNEKKTVLFSGR